MAVYTRVGECACVIALRRAADGHILNRSLNVVGIFVLRAPALIIIKNNGRLFLRFLLSNTRTRARMARCFYCAVLDRTRPTTVTPVIRNTYIQVGGSILSTKVAVAYKRQGF